MGQPFTWKPNRLRDAGKFAGKTDRVLGTQPGLEMGPGTRRVSEVPAEVKAWRDAHRPEFGGISALGGLASHALTRPSQVRELTVDPEHPETSNPDYQPMDHADERDATHEAIKSERQGRLI